MFWRQFSALTAILSFVLMVTSVGCSSSRSPEKGADQESTFQGTWVSVDQPVKDSCLNGLKIDRAGTVKDLRCESKIRDSVSVLGTLDEKGKFSPLPSKSSPGKIFSYWLDHNNRLIAQKYQRTRKGRSLISTDIYKSPSHQKMKVLEGKVSAKQKEDNNIATTLSGTHWHLDEVHYTDYSSNEHYKFKPGEYLKMVREKATPPVELSFIGPEHVLINDLQRVALYRIQGQKLWIEDAESAEKFASLGAISFRGDSFVLVQRDFGKDESREASVFTYKPGAYVHEIDSPQRPPSDKKPRKKAQGETASRAADQI